MGEPMLESLKPCPDCGASRAVLRTYRASEDTMCAYVVCLACGTETEHMEDALCAAPRTVQDMAARGDLPGGLANRNAA